MVSSVVMRSAAAGITVTKALTRWFSSMRKREEWVESNRFSSTFTSRQTAPSAVSTTLLSFEVQPVGKGAVSQQNHISSMDGFFKDNLQNFVPFLVTSTTV